MAVGLLFGAFWFGLGVLMWWWPAAIFVAFGNEDVTPGARAFGVVAMLIGAFFVLLEVLELGTGVAVPVTVSTVGVLSLLKPINAPGTSPDGPITPRAAGVVLAATGVLWAALVVT